MLLVRVSSIEGNNVILSDGRKIAFNALVVACGVHYPSITANAGDTFAERSLFVRDFNEKIKAAKNILIGGAGPVGVEVASELRRINPNCIIQLVTSGNNALPSWSGSPAAAVTDRLLKTKIDVITNARINLPEGISGTNANYEKTDYTLSTGQVVSAVDIFIPFFGLARTEFLPDSMKENRGFVRANMQGQSPVQSNIFAVGCGNQYPVINQDNIAKEASVVATNVSDMFEDKKLSATLPDGGAMPDLLWAHFGLGQFTAMNLEQQGFIPGLLAWCCGCGCPLMPCCACCGWPCSYPASECSGKCLEKMLLSMGNPHGLHAASPPVMVDMMSR